MTDFAERRKQPRVELILKVDYPNPADFVADYACDASEGGMFIATRREFKLGDQVTFDISFPGLMEPIHCQGVVCWKRGVKIETDDKPAGIGISFVFQNEEARREITDLVSRFTVSSAPRKAMIGSPTLRVLIVEDSKITREMFRFAMTKLRSSESLSMENVKVVEAEDGKTAWEILQTERFDLAIFDYFMPVFSGGELIRKIRQKEELKLLPIIVISSGGSEVCKECYSAGADLFLDKPVLLMQLFECAQMLMGMKRVQSRTDKKEVVTSMQKDQPA
jgi:uncharacterized protein (TIGR02266 family)